MTRTTFILASSFTNVGLIPNTQTGGGLGLLLYTSKKYEMKVANAGCTEPSKEDSPLASSIQ